MNNTGFYAHLHLIEAEDERSEAGKARQLRRSVFFSIVIVTKQLLSGY